MFPPSHSPPRRTLNGCLAAMLVAMWCCAPLPAQFRDGFESPDVTWKLSGADCGVRVALHERTFRDAHGGSGCEHLQFTAGRGTFIHYALPIERAPIINELNPSIWLKSDKARLRVMVRVVLPRTLDESTGQPITTLIRGDEYGELGSWQQLSIPELPKLLQRETVVLRRQHGPHVDPREAYVDSLILNAYGGPGETNIWIDDLEVFGVLDAEWAKNAMPEGPDGASTQPGESGSRPTVAAAPPARVDGSVFLLEGKPFFLRAVTHHGEKLEFLKYLGFNAVRMTSPPSGEQNEEAKRLGIWLLAPPPDFQDDPAAANRLDRVIAWMLGDELQSRDLADLRELAAETRSADRNYRRPLVCGARDNWWSFSRETDLLLFDTGAAFSPLDYGGMRTSLLHRSQAGRSGAPFWAVLPLVPSVGLQEQLILLDPTRPASPQIDLDQARQAMFAALASGPRGLFFPSSAKLDAEDERTQHFASVLRLLNRELEVLEPWLAGGTQPQELAVGDASLQVVGTQTERSRLILVSRPAPRAQYVLGAPAVDTFNLTIPGIPVADRIFHVTSDGLRQLRGPVGGSGSRITVEEAGHAAAIVITQDPLVIRHLAAKSESQRRDMVETRLRLAANRLTDTALVLEQVRHHLRVPPAVNVWMGDAQSLLAQADQLLARGDFTGCYRFTRRVENLTAQTRRIYWDVAVNGFPSPSASPCCATFDLLPAHYQLAARLQQADRMRNGLPGGDFENLEGLLNAGWRQQRRESPHASALVELSREQPHGGASSLHLAAVGKSSQAETAALHGSVVGIQTAPVAVKRGQVARIRGWVRMPPSPHAALQIHDSCAGPSLAEIVSNSPAWREFTLYRAASADGPFTVQFDLVGIGEAFVDDVTIEMIVPKSP